MSTALMGCLVATGLSMTAASPPPKSSLDQAVEALVAPFRPFSERGVALGEQLAFEVAFEVDPDGTGGDATNRDLEALRSYVARLVEGRLSRSAAMSATQRPNAPVRSGAEWLFRVSLSVGRADLLGMRAELVQIDRGLWGATFSPPRAPLAGVARSQTSLSEALFAAGRAPPRVPDAPADEIGVFRIAALSERVLDVESCWKNAVERVLIVLSDQGLYAYEGDRLERRRIAALSLDPLPKATPPTKAPVGAVVCGGIDAGNRPGVAFSSNVLALGHIAVWGPDGTLEVTDRTFSGLPVALHTGEVVSARVDPRNRWQWAEDHREFLQVIESSGLTLGLSEELEWRALSGGALTKLVGGIGSSVAHLEGQAWLLSTSATTWRGSDQITLVRTTDGKLGVRPIELPGPVRASAIEVWSNGKLEAVVAVREPLASSTELYFVAEAQEP